MAKKMRLMVKFQNLHWTLEGLEEVKRAHVWVSVGESHVQKMILAGIARLHSLTPYDPIISDTELCPMDVDMI